MKPLLTCLVSLALFSAPDQESSGGVREVEVEPCLEAFRPLVGTTWRAAFPGGELFDTQRFEWMLGGRFLRNLHQVTRGAEGDVVYEGETVYGWDHEEERLRWWYFNSTGGHVVGDLVVEEGRWVAEGENRGPAGQRARVRTELVLGDGEWTSTSFVPQGTEWSPVATLEFEPLPN